MLGATHFSDHKTFAPFERFGTSFSVASPANTDCNVANSTSVRFEACFPSARVVVIFSKLGKFTVLSDRGGSKQSTLQIKTVPSMIEAPTSVRSFGFAALVFFVTGIVMWTVTMRKWKAGPGHFVDCSGVAAADFRVKARQAAAILTSLATPISSTILPHAQKTDDPTQYVGQTSW